MQSILETLLPLRMAAVIPFYIHIAGRTRPAVTRSRFSDWIILLTYRESVSRDREIAWRLARQSHVNHPKLTRPPTLLCISAYVLRNIQTFISPLFLIQFIRVFQH